MKKILVLAALSFLACSDDSSDESVTNVAIPDRSDSIPGSSDSELQQSSSSVLDAFIEYVEPPKISCEPVESIMLESEIDTSYTFYSFGFYGDDMIAIPQHRNMYGIYGHEDDAPIDTFYVKKDGEDSWQKRAAFENYMYDQEGNKLCIVGENLAIIRVTSEFSKEGRELCHSGDGENWSCDSLPEKVFLTCDDKYFYKGEEKSGSLAYSENAVDWTPIDFRFDGGIHSLHETFTSDTARIVVVNYNKWNEDSTDYEWRVAILYSKDMVSWDTTDVMYGVAYGAARLGDVYVLGIGAGGTGFVRYSKDLKNWNIAKQENGDYFPITYETSMAVSNGALIVAGTYGYIFTSRNGQDFRVYKGACGTNKAYSSVIADSHGDFYALHLDRSSPDKYEIIRIVE